MLVAALAISIALVGTAAAGPIDNPIAQDSRLTKKDRRIAAKISRNITLRLMRRFSPRFADQQITKRAPGLSVANAENANSADNADNAANAAQLDGKDPDSYAPSEAEPVHIVGDPGEPAFEGTWGVGGGEQVPGFWKDPFGTVHLQGHAGRTGADGTIFTLPPGYRPTENSYYSVYPSGGSGDMAIQVLATGQVNLFYLESPADDNFVGLNEISFRAAGS